VGELAALANAVVWALTGVVTKGVGKNVKPVHIVTAQAWIGLTVLVIIGLIVGQMDDLAHAPLGSALLLAGGAVINTFGSLTFWIAISRGRVSSVYPTTQSIFILISVITGWIFLGDKPQAGIIGGAALIISGVILLNWKSFDQQMANKPRGDYVAIGLAILTSILWTGGFVTTAIGIEDTKPLPAAIIRNFVPALLFLGVSIAMPSMRLTRVFKGNTVRLVIGALLFAVSSLTFVFALDNAPPGVVVLLVNTSPMWAVLLASFVLRERLTRYALSGTLLSLSGIFVVLAFK
jgi:drug/metabolite transporter (DMT)-like permease